MDCIHGWKLYLQFIFFAYGVYASRINTALIAVTLILSKRKSRCYVMKLRPYMIFIGFFTPGVLVLILLIVVTSYGKYDGVGKRSLGDNNNMCCTI